MIITAEQRNQITNDLILNWEAEAHKKMVTARAARATGVDAQAAALEKEAGDLLLAAREAANDLIPVLETVDVE